MEDKTSCGPWSEDPPADRKTWVMKSATTDWNNTPTFLNLAYNDTRACDGHGCPLTVIIIKNFEQKTFIVVPTRFRNGAHVLYDTLYRRARMSLRIIKMKEDILSIIFLFRFTSNKRHSSSLYINLSVHQTVPVPM